MNKSEVTRIRLTPIERAALQAAADTWGGTISEALRWAIRAQYIEPSPPRARMNEGRAAVHEAAGAPFCVQS